MADDDDKVVDLGSRRKEQEANRRPVESIRILAMVPLEATVSNLDEFDSLAQQEGYEAIEGARPIVEQAFEHDVKVTIEPDVARIREEGGTFLIDKSIRALGEATKRLGCYHYTDANEIADEVIKVCSAVLDLALYLKTTNEA